MHKGIITILIIVLMLMAFGCQTEKQSQEETKRSPVQPEVKELPEVLKEDLNESINELEMIQNGKKN